MYNVDMLEGRARDQYPNDENKQKINDAVTSIKIVSIPPNNPTCQTLLSMESTGNWNELRTMDWKVKIDGTGSFDKVDLIKLGGFEDNAMSSLQVKTTS